MSTKDLLLTDRQKIRNALGKTEKSLFEDIQILKNWLLTQQHLPEIPGDNVIEYFLTNCKFSIEKTKQTLDMYYTARSLVPDMYRGTHPCSPEMEAAFNTGDFVPLPKLTPSLHRVSVFKYKNINASESDIRRIYAHGFANVYEIRFHEDLALGDIFVADCEYIKLGVTAKITPILIKQCTFILEKVLCNRVKGIHFLKAPSYFEKIILLLKSLFKNKKLSDRVFSHQTIEELGKHIPIELLPSDYGGKEKSVQELAGLWRQKFFEYKDRFDKLERMNVNEALRPDKLKSDELLGYYGNFKTIDTD